MDDKTNNPFISFYTQHNISPVRQDIADFRRHMTRREKLFNTLGLPQTVFAHCSILEVGPGSGYNALACFAWGAIVDFVEPNPKAQEELQELFERHGIEKERWRLFKGTFEDFRPQNGYDVIIAEGFIPSLPNRDVVIAKMAELVNPGGVVVVTCSDDTGYFFDILKRLIGHHLVKSKGITEFDGKVKLLCRAFESHLKSLKFASRLTEDWIKDQFFTPYLSSKFFSIADCVEEFGEGFTPLGTSPSMFTDYTWYKDVDFDCRKSVLDQFYRKRHALMHFALDESVRDVELNKGLEKKIREFRWLVNDSENDLSESLIDELISLLLQIRDLSKDIDDVIPEAIDEGISLLRDKNIDEMKISGARKLSTAFGKGQQYMSLVKKFTS